MRYWTSVFSTNVNSCQTCSVWHFVFRQHCNNIWVKRCYFHVTSHVHTHTRFLTALFPGLARSASTREVKPIWILLKQETVSASGISWAICKSAPCSRQITRPAPRRFFTGRMPFLPPNEQRQSTEGKLPVMYSSAKTLIWWGDKLYNLSLKHACQKLLKCKDAYFMRHNV